MLSPPWTGCYRYQATRVVFFQRALLTRTRVASEGGKTRPSSLPLTARHSRGIEVKRGISDIFVVLTKENEMCSLNPDRTRFGNIRI